MRLKEAEIRPENLRQGQSERFDADVRRLLERARDFVRVSCPACCSGNAKKAFTKFEFSYAECVECGTIYINPRPTPEILSEYYATSESYAYWNKYIFPASESIRRQKIFRPRAERLVTTYGCYNVGRGTFLEVGAGFGTFCEEIKCLGYFQRVIAVEPMPQLAETCRLRGIEVIDRPIDQVNVKASSVDAIASFEVIEHLFCPKEFLGACADMLKEGGVLTLTCPNGRGFDISALGSLSDTVDPEHLNYFNPASLSLLVEACGFNVLEVLTPGELDAELVRKKALQGAFDLSGHPFLRRVLLEDWERLGNAFQQFLADSLLSSHMWLVARKGTA